MKAAILSLVLLQCLYCSGLPLFQFDHAPIAQKAVRMSLAKINGQSASANLYGTTHSSVKKVVHVGTNMYDLMLNFKIRETVCPKSPGNDPEKCQFKQGYFVSTASCSSRVRVTSEVPEIVSLTCSRGHSSSSSESHSGEAR